MHLWIIYCTPSVPKWMPGFSNKFMGRDANHNPTFCDYLKKSQRLFSCVLVIIVITKFCAWLRMASQSQHFAIAIIEFTVRFSKLRLRFFICDCDCNCDFWLRCAIAIAIFKYSKILCDAMWLRLRCHYIIVF